MTRQIKISEYHTGTDGDALNGTLLETAPSRGIIMLKAASTVNTATITISRPGKGEIADAEPLPLRANGVPEAGDPPYVIPVMQGERPHVELGGTTGTILLSSHFIGS